MMMHIFFAKIAKLK